MTTISFPPWFRTVGISMLILLGVAALVPQGDRPLGVPWIGRRKLWLVTLVLVPLLLLLSVSFARPLYIVGRYDLIGFPAYALVLGLGAAKIQRWGRLGPWLVWVVAACLLGIIGTKLYLYYHTATPANIANARITASFLSTNVKDGDMVVFTGLRGGPILYYLQRLGYEWKAGRCVREKDGRNFGCRMFPLETESNVGSYEAGRVWDSPEEVRSDVESITRDLQNDHNRLWIAVAPERVQSKTILLMPGDYLLVKELEHQGYALGHLHGELRIFRFDKNATPDRR